MTKQIVTFNVPYASVTSYDAASGLNNMRVMDGVKDVQLYRATAGQPTYMLIVDVEDDKAAAVQTFVEGMMAQYASDLQDVSFRTFRPL
jgi:hypothetical protein